MVERNFQHAALPALCEDIRRARLALRSARSARIPVVPAREAQQALADAIGAYIEALTERGFPVPYSLRDEMRIYRVLDPVSSRSGQRRQGPPSQPRPSRSW